MQFPVFCCRYRLTVVTSKIRLRPDIRCRVSESGIWLKINIRPSLASSDSVSDLHARVHRAGSLPVSANCPMTACIALRWACPHSLPSNQQSHTAVHQALPNRTGCVEHSSENTAYKHYINKLNIIQQHSDSRYLRQAYTGSLDLHQS